MKRERPCKTCFQSSRSGPGMSTFRANGDKASCASRRRTPVDASGGDIYEKRLLWLEANEHRLRTIDLPPVGVPAVGSRVPGLEITGSPVDAAHRQRAGDV